MTEREWLECDCPDRLLTFLRGQDEPPDARKLRLFACACCWRLEEYVTPDWWALIELCERLAGTVALEWALRTARQKLQRNWGWRDKHSLEAMAEQAVEFAAAPDLVRAIPDVLCLARAAERAARNRVGGQWSGGADPGRIQADLLRCVFGNPFGTAAFDPVWRTPDVLAIVRTVHDDQAFAHLPILGDALEDAGATHQRLLGHCRQDAHHARGCWAVGLTLGDP